MVKQRIHTFQLVDENGKAITDAGGVVAVTADGTPNRVALQDADGVAVTQPAALTKGQVLFRVADSVETVDVFILSPTGHFLVLKGLKAGDRREARVDTQQRLTTYVIPFDQVDADITAATEYDTGFELAANDLVLPEGMGVLIETADATESMDVGLLASETGGDANGFMDTLLTSVVGFVQAEVGFNVGSNASYMDLTGGDVEFTYGVLMCAALTKVAVSEGADTNTDEGFWLLRPHIGDGTAKTISLTTTTGSDTAAGYIHLPVRLGVSP